MTPVAAEGAVDETVNAFVDTQPGIVPAGVESTEAGEAREGGRRRRRGGRGGRDRDESRAPTAEGEAAGETAPEVQAGPDERASVDGDQAPLADAEANPAVEGSEVGGERDGRRRSRGGRNRRDRGEGRPDAPADGSADAAAASPETAEAQAVAEATAAPVAVAYNESPAPTPAPEVRPAPAAGPIAFKSLLVPTTATSGSVEPVAEATPAPVPMKAATPAPTATAFVLETDALQAVAETAGLQWVNSDSDKIRAAQEAMAKEAKPMHVARAPKPVVSVDEGPLVLVETRKDLSQVKLPFETDAGSAPTN